MAHHLSVTEIQRHHDHLIAEIHQGYERITTAAIHGKDVTALRDRYVQFLKDELIPHATTEEETIYQDGSQQRDLAALVDAMIDEHRRIIKYINDLELAADAVTVVAAASQFISLLDAHFDKENRLLLPSLSQQGLLAH